MLSGYLLHPLDLLQLQEIKTLPKVQKTGRIRTELLEVCFHKIWRPKQGPEDACTQSRFMTVQIHDDIWAFSMVPQSPISQTLAPHIAQWPIACNP